MIFRNISLYLLFLSGVSASAGSLRRLDAADAENLSHGLLFKAWSDTHGKDYGSEDTIMKRMRVWLENHSKSHVI